MLFFKELYQRLVSIGKLLFSKDYLLIHQSKSKITVRNTFPANIIAQSGKAFYIK